MGFFVCLFVFSLTQGGKERSPMADILSLIVLISLYPLQMEAGEIIVTVACCTHLSSLSVKRGSVCVQSLSGCDWLDIQSSLK